VGHHYIPQRYLKNFAITGRPNFIWLYDKERGTRTPAAIKQVAQEPRFYEPEVETELADRVERPANVVLQKVIAGDRISQAEREAIVYYMATMIMRVPNRRLRALELVPQASDEAAEDLRTELPQLDAQRGISPAKTQERISEGLRLLERCRADPLNSFLAQRIRSPWPTKAVFRSLLHMTWRVMTTKGPSFFITSDNPASFFRCWGVARPKSELVFPLSTTDVLHGSFQKPIPEVIRLEVPQSIVRVVNGRVAYDATRFSFYHEEVDWIDKMWSKSDPYLSRIQW